MHDIACINCGSENVVVLSSIGGDYEFNGICAGVDIVTFQCKDCGEIWSE